MTKINEANWKVYCYTSPSNKRYIGITHKTLEQRSGPKGERYSGCTVFYKAIKKYGWDNFKKEILYDGLTKQEAEKKEKELIRLYKTQNSKYGYNILEGGQANVLPKKIKDKMKKNRKGTKAHGWKHKPSLIVKQTVSNKLKGIKRSNKTKNKLSKSHSRTVYQYDLEGNYIKSYKNCLEASKETGFSRTHINATCLFKQLTSNGYFWSFEYIENRELIKKYLNKEIKISPIIFSKSREIEQYDINKNFIRKFNSIKEASLETKIPEQQISFSCKNNRLAGDYYWTYSNKEEKIKNHFKLSVEDFLNGEETSISNFC